MEQFEDEFQMVTKEVLPRTIHNFTEQLDEAVIVESEPEDLLNSFRDLLRAEKETTQDKGFWNIINKKELLDNPCFVSQLYVLYRDEGFDNVTGGKDIESFAKYLSYEGKNTKNIKEAKLLVAKLTQNISDGVKIIDKPISSSSSTPSSSSFRDPAMAHKVSATKSRRTKDGKVELSFTEILELCTDLTDDRSRK